MHAVQEKKAVDVVVLDLRKAGGFTDYFVICTGTNPRQIHAIADSVEETLRTSFGERPHLDRKVQASIVADGPSLRRERPCAVALGKGRRREVSRERAPGWRSVCSS